MKPRYANRKGLRARFLGKLHGKRIFEWPVEWTVGEAAALTQENFYPKGVVKVIAPTAAEAADLIADRETLGTFACVEISVWGPKAGLAAKRFWGWDRAIWNQLLNHRENRQLHLSLTS
jgi:hypothetical protein